MFGSFGVPELVVLLLILIVIFGPKKLPLLGRGMGEGIRNFKRGLKSDDKNEIEDSTEAKGSEAK